MSSKAFYKPSSVAPRLVRGISAPRSGCRAVEVWTTPCIVTRFGRSPPSRCTILINPGNPQLSGVRNFPYFPRGGPVPPLPVASATHRDWQPLGFVSSWGGMEIGSGMLYPVGVVDGLVHLRGGWGLQAEIAALRVKRRLRHGGGHDDELCPVGSAVRTSAGGWGLPGGPSGLREHYDAVVHASPPFYRHDAQPHEKLRQCYESALELAFGDNGDRTKTRVATPLLGAGARGFPHDVASEVAADAAVSWCLAQKAEGDNPVGVPLQTLAFGLLEEDRAEQLVERLEHAFQLQQA